AIDGRLDNLEDLVSIVTAPAINSPINEALTLSDIEIDSLSHKFRSRSRLAMGAGLIFVLLMAATLLYNTVYRVQATGLIAGNISRVTANTSGIIQAVYVEPDAYTKAGTRLFTVENPQQQLTLQSLRAKLRERKSQLSSLQKLATQDTSPALLNSLEAKLNRNKRDFEQAKALYKQHIVSFKDLKYLESQLNLSQIAYNREVKNSLTQNLAVRKQINELSIEIKSLTEQEAIVRSAGASQTVHSLHDGKVFQIEHAAGSYVGSKDVVMLLEKNEQPVVLIRLLHNDALKVRLGMPAKIYVPIDDREYDAKISAIGHTAINSASTDSMEASLDETLIKLEFDNQDLRFPANARVKVWIRTF
ncbi:MAG: HlyD family efflux transporter periplasmic adaptor subunit, partial [Proteobacteria bacterium]|nr:HlyD family efflux transporter periplasmic adaptor subunit [Pseudomonadota bacterium]